MSNNMSNFYQLLVISLGLSLGLGLGLGLDLGLGLEFVEKSSSTISEICY